ncbi:MAG: methyltransferase domain-containing protein [Pseudomonadota bacterium]
MEWITSPAEGLRFDDEQFDCVVSQFGLMYFENKETAVKEMHRVLKPNGHLAVLVWDELENNPGLAAEEYLWQKFLGGEIDSTPYAMGDSAVLEKLFKPLNLGDFLI